MVFNKDHQNYSKEVRSHVSLFEQNHLCYVSASVLHLLFDFQLI